MHLTLPSSGISLLLPPLAGSAANLAEPGKCQTEEVSGRWPNPASGMGLLLPVPLKGCRNGKGPSCSHQGHHQIPLRARLWQNTRGCAHHRQPLDEQIWVSQLETPLPSLTPSSQPQPGWGLPCPGQHPPGTALNGALTFGRQGRMLTTAAQMQMQD